MYLAPSIPFPSALKSRLTLAIHTKGCHRSSAGEWRKQLSDMTRADRSKSHKMIYNKFSSICNPDKIAFT